MNRTIKFRAWDGVKMRFPSRNLYIENYDGCPQWQFGDDITPMNEWIVMQYTGLEDKNGKEIYEGDIVCVPDYQYDPTNKNAPNELHIVKYADGCYRLGDNFLDSDYLNEYSREDTEVIGNVWENPDLIK